MWKDKYLVSFGLFLLITPFLFADDFLQLASKGTATQIESAIKAGQNAWPVQRLDSANDGGLGQCDRRAISVLVKAGWMLKKNSAMGLTALMCAAQLECVIPDVMTELLKARLNVYEQDISGETGLCMLLNAI